MDSELTTELLVGLAIAVGLVGIVVPILPGALLVWAAILVWALLTQSLSGWVVLAIASAAIVAAQIVKYLVPQRRLRTAGVPPSSIVAGGVVGVIGFFVIPVVGLVIGFVAGIYAAEHRRLRGRDDAWQATKTAMRAVGLAIVIELAGTLAAAGAWLTAVVLT